MYIEDVPELADTVLHMKQMYHITMVTVPYKFDDAVRLDAYVIYTLGSIRVVRSSELVVRCVEWVSHVDESMNEVMSLTHCTKHN